MISGEDAWVTANKNVAKNLSDYGGAYNGALIDSAVQEYNLKTGKLLRSWDALEHIPLGDSRATVPTNGFPWDAYHVNAIDLTGDGTFLVSMRNTWAAYLVNIATGKIEWTLGGRHSSFKFGPSAEFQWQHDVAFGVGGDPGFDGHAVRRPLLPADRRRHLRAGHGASRGLVLKLDQQTQTATLVPQYTGGDEFESEYMGDTQPLQNGNTFDRLGLGALLHRVRARGQAAAGSALPGERPELPHDAGAVGRRAAHRPRGRRPPGGRHTTVYASWNGATEVASWRVLAGPERRHSAGSGTRRRRGPDDRRGERRQVRVRDGDLGAGGLPELRGAGARRGRAGDRSIPPVHAVGSMADESSGRRGRRTGEKTGALEWV